MKKLKILGSLFLGLALTFILLILFLFVCYDKPMPEGEQGEAAERLAYKMLDALAYDKYKETNLLSWTFRGKHTYAWSRKEGKCKVIWENKRVHLVLNNKQDSTVFVDDIEYTGTKKKELVDQAQAYFNNDSFWLVAPYKVFDLGVERRYIKTEEGRAALLVTYTKGGKTPGDSYLWHFDAQGVPTSFQLWVDLIPLGGLHASWEDWKTTTSGAKIAAFHQLSFLGIELTDIQGISF